MTTLIAVFSIANRILLSSGRKTKHSMSVYLFDTLQHARLFDHFSYHQNFKHSLPASLSSSSSSSSKQTVDFSGCDTTCSLDEL